ncbi:unnamed protein product [Schistosoma margrebowiei]|uniref:Uncharacterized protein n=1 Tax=Schistosoma margrebowiei TaxID=48269 RepID=A0A183MIF4_9TREM|nr:unnamed protein product [Schistosoma margrebowiei]
MPNYVSGTLVGEKLVQQSINQVIVCQKFQKKRHQLRICKPSYQNYPHSENELDGYDLIKQYESYKMEQSENTQTYA